MLGSRSFYAKWHNIIFEFQDKRYRDWVVAHSCAEYISAKDAYNSGLYDNHWIKISHQAYKRSSAYGH